MPRIAPKPLLFGVALSGMAHASAGWSQPAAETPAPPPVTAPAPVCQVIIKTVSDQICPSTRQLFNQCVAGGVVTETPIDCA